MESSGPVPSVTATIVVPNLEMSQSSAGGALRVIVHVFLKTLAYYIGILRSNLNHSVTLIGSK